MAEKDLARAIIKQALRDSLSKKDTQIRREGRNFLLGSSPAWRNSLEDVCLLAELNPYKIIKKAQFLGEKWVAKTKIFKKFIKILIFTIYKHFFLSYSGSVDLKRKENLK